MRLNTIIILLLCTWVAQGQTIKYHGIYESITEGESSSYFRFYPDGIVIATSTAPNSKEVIKKWFNYENRNKLNKGFYFFEGDSLFISTFEPLIGRLFMKIGQVKNNGELIEMRSYFYDDGIVKKNIYTNPFIFKPFD